MMSVWRKLLSVRSIEAAQRVWHANKLSSPTVRALLERTQGIRVAVYNARKAISNLGEEDVPKHATAQVAFMVRFSRL